MWNFLTGRCNKTGDEKEAWDRGEELLTEKTSGHNAKPIALATGLDHLGNRTMTTTQQIPTGDQTSERYSNWSLGANIVFLTVKKVEVGLK